MEAPVRVKLDPEDAVAVFYPEGGKFVPVTSPEFGSFYRPGEITSPDHSMFWMEGAELAKIERIEEPWVSISDPRINPEIRQEAIADYAARPRNIDSDAPLASFAVAARLLGNSPDQIRVTEEDVAAARAVSSDWSDDRRAAKADDAADDIIEDAVAIGFLANADDTTSRPTAITSRAARPDNQTDLDQNSNNLPADATKLEKIKFAAHRMLGTTYAAAEIALAPVFSMVGKALGCREGPAPELNGQPLFRKAVDFEQSPN